jgi:phosphoribosyl 1,2-cyclic phosphodiesterase
MALKLLYLRAKETTTMTHDLTVRFLGVRGSIATPGLSAGGNTACVEVVAGDTRIILDAGTGLRTLGNERMASGPRHSTILLSHLHWDHVAGLQFFTPVYVPGHRVEIASGPNGVMSHDAAIRSLFKAPFFPVDFDDLGGTVTTRELRANDTFTIGDITITMARLNHPDPVYGYRLEHAGQSIVYATDTEHFSCVDPTLKKLAAGADILIYDAQYTPEEYQAKVGWGHSTVRRGRRGREERRREAARSVPPRPAAHRRGRRRDRAGGVLALLELDRRA